MRGADRTGTAARDVAAASSTFTAAVATFGGTYGRVSIPAVGCPDEMGAPNTRPRWVVGFDDIIASFGCSGSGTGTAGRVRGGACTEVATGVVVPFAGVAAVTPAFTGDTTRPVFAATFDFTGGTTLGVTVATFGFTGGTTPGVTVATFGLTGGTTPGVTVATFGFTGDTTPGVAACAIVGVLRASSGAFVLAVVDAGFAAPTATVGTGADFVAITTGALACFVATSTGVLACSSARGFESGRVGWDVGAATDVGALSSSGANSSTASGLSATAAINVSAICDARGNSCSDSAHGEPGAGRRGVNRGL